MVVCVECLPADKPWDVVSVTRRSSGVAPRACVRVYVRVLVPPNLYIQYYIHTHTYTYTYINKKSLPYVRTVLGNTQSHSQISSVFRVRARLLRCYLSKRNRGHTTSHKNTPCYIYYKVELYKQTRLVCE